VVWHFQWLSSLDDLSVRVSNDLKRETWDSESNQQLDGWSRVGHKGDGNLETSSRRVIVVEDSEPFRKFVCSALEKIPEFQIVGEVSDGLEAVQKAEELHPDLILLDIGLPSLNGIEAARRIRKLCSKSKILFVSAESTVDLVHEALCTGATGYVVKIDAGSELLAAVNAVLRGDQFVGRRFSGHDFIQDSHAAASEDLKDTMAIAG